MCNQTVELAILGKIFGTFQFQPFAMILKINYFYDLNLYF